MRGKIYIALLFCLLLPLSLWSGTTGKIAGTIIDKTTGDPLPGANIIIKGTTLGAAADIKGHYTILYVPPGVFDIEISVIGYTKMTVSAVRVLIDQTARVDVDLEVEAVEGEAVTIVAERTLIKKDVATSVISVSDKEVEELPVSNVNEVIKLQAGIEDDLKIRGSKSDAALFMLDGVALRDPRSNQPIAKVALSAVKEISVERGGFNAEYGQVQSGIINVVTKEGGKNSYNGSITAKVAPPAPKYYRGNGIPDVHDPNSYWMRPYLDDDVCWTGTTNGAWDEYTQLQYLPFNGWNAVSELLLSDNDPDNDLTPLGCQRVFMYETRKRQRNELADYEIDGGFGGPVPLVSEILGNLRFYTSYRRDRDVLLWPAARPDYVDYDWMLRLTSDIAPSMKLRLSALTGNISTLADNGWSDRFYPHWPNEIADGTGGRTEFNMFSDWAWSLADIKHRSLAAKFTHTLSPSTFYEISLDYFQRQYYTRPTALRDTSKVYEILPGYFVDEYPLGYWPTELVGVTPNIADGIQASLARDFSKVSSATLKADLTSQINFSNLIKAGVEFIYNDLNMDYGYIQMQTQGKTYGRQVQMHNFPVRAAAYIQDKLETEGFTMNAGLRLDYSDSKMEWWDVDFYNPYFISSKYNEDRVFAMKESKAQWQLSPRLGISHPITENSKLFFNYGHFKQMPQYETLFKIDRNANNELNRIGDPSLTLAKTISYELGYDHILSNDFLVQVAAFYRDISNQQDTTRYWSINSGDYYLTTSNNYEDIRGFEVTLRKTAGRWFSGFANYTYQVTTRGNFGSPERFEDPSSQKEYDEETVHIYQERITPAPYARTNLNFYTPDDFGPVLAGHHVLGGFMLNFLLSWSQGGWTTYNPKSASGEVNNVQFVDKYDGMLQASKTISFKHFRVQLLVDIANLFNRLELSDTDNQQYRQSLHLPRNKAYDNIPGEDKFGDYRKPGVEWQPIEYRAEVQGTTPTEDDITIYYEGKTGIYWQSVNGQWTMVDSRRMYQILEDKAYIFNPGPSTWYFLNPRKITFGIRVSFDLN